MLGDIWEYIQAIGLYWWLGLLAIEGVLALLERFIPGKTFPPSLFIGVGIAFLAIAPFSAWRVSQERIEYLESQHVSFTNEEFSKTLERHIFDGEDLLDQLAEMRSPRDDFGRDDKMIDWINRADRDLKFNRPSWAREFSSGIEFAPEDYTEQEEFVRHKIETLNSMLDRLQVGDIPADRIE